MTQQRYSTVAVVLHWAIAILILGQIGGGLYMHNLPNSAAMKFDLYQLHKSFGLSVLVLTAARIAWRMTHRPPALPAQTPVWQRLAARATHLGFYGLIVLTPLVGWAIVSVSPTDIPTKWFGLIPVPHLPIVAETIDRAAAEDVFKELHEYLAFAILFLLVLHVAAALKHSFIDKDGVLRSMMVTTSGQRIGLAAVFSFLALGAVVYAALPASSAQSLGAATANEGTGANWIVDYDRSRLGFVGEEKGRRFEGEFTDFQASIYFNPENLEATRINVIVATGSARTGDSLRDSTIPAREWFHTAEHPTAGFDALEVRVSGDGVYETDGTLRIKDYEKPVTLTFEVDIVDGKAIARGKANLVRTDFGLGIDKSWLEEERVAMGVSVEFEIFADKAQNLN
ncbi:MAG: cytochrome b/b6 domain-containing protein [Hyphococcus sp.]